MPRAALQLEGGRQLRRALKQAGIDLGELKDVHRNAGTIALGAATPPRRSGALASSQRVGATNAAGTLRAGGGKVKYAQPIHWGWPSRGIKQQPWLSVAAQESEPRWVGLYERFIETILDRIQGI